MYTSLTDLKTYLGMAMTETEDDYLLSSIIARAQAGIDAACGGRSFEAAADTTRFFDVMLDTDGPSLYFDTDCAQITTVKHNLDNGSGGVVIASSQYVTLPRNETPYYGIRLKGSNRLAWEYTSDPEGAISVAGRWAYSVVPPDDIRHVCTRWAAHMYRQKDAQVFDVTASPEMGTITVPQGMPADVKILLEPYIKRV